MKTVTVFTPTYNREDSLPRLYESLQRQTCFDFEWLIVDDGSTDQTAALVQKYLEEDNAFPIRYYRKENGGKHTAINYGVKEAQGLLFFFMDSDDLLTEQAVERLIAWERTIEDRSQFAGVSGNKGDLSGNLLGETFSGRQIDATNLERQALRILGDKAEAYYTEVLRQYPFPVFEGERFMPESIVFDRIGAAGLKIRWVNEVIYLVDQRQDGLVAQGNRRFANSPKGYALSTIQTMNVYQYNRKQRLLAGFYFYETVKENVSIAEAAGLLERRLVPFVLFWIYQKMKIWLKESVLQKRPICNR